MWRQIVLNERHLGSVYLRSDLSELAAFLNQSAAAVAIIIALFCSVVYVLASRVQRTISGPILALAETAGNISRSRDYSVRATKHSRDETGALTDAFKQQTLSYLRATDAKLGILINFGTPRVEYTRIAN